MTIREKAYVTFTFQDRTVILPSVFEASVTAMTSGNVLDLVRELVPNPDELLNDLTISEFGDFVAAWTEASKAAQPQKQPSKAQKIYRHVWFIFWLIVAAAWLTLTVASIWVDPWPQVRWTLAGLTYAHLLYVFAVPGGNHDH